MPSGYRGHIVGQKPPLKPREVWSIRTRLQVSGAERDLALFNLAIDSKLRGCDLVAITVGDPDASRNVAFTAEHRFGQRLNVRYGFASVGLRKRVIRSRRNGCGRPSTKRTRRSRNRIATHDRVIATPIIAVPVNRMSARRAQ